jgi:hypothetical protein
MTRRDYALVAKAILELGLEPEIKEYIAEKMASKLSVYPNFNSKVFIENCKE